MKNLISLIAFTFLLLTLIPAAYSAENAQMQPVIVRALRNDVLLGDANKSVSVITEEEIKGSGARNIAELIGQKTSIVMTDYLSSPKGVKLDLRGFGETSELNLLVLIDGRRTNQVDLSGVDFGQISLESIERIEIIKGASTVLYGDNAEAGVINIVTKTGRKANKGEMPSATIGAQMGSYQTHKEFTAVNGNTDKADYTFNYAHQETTGYRVNDEYWSNNYSGNVSLYPTDDVLVDISSGYYRDRYGQPGALFAANIATMGRQGSRFPSDYFFISDGFLNVTPKLNFKVADSDAEFSLFSSIRKRNSESFSVSATTYETIHKILTKELQPKVIVNTVINESLLNRLTLGFDYFSAVDRIRSGTQGSAEDFLNIKKHTYGVYALEHLTVDEKFLIDVGARSSWAEYDFNQAQVQTADSDKSINAAAYNIGFGYKYNPTSQVYFDVSKSYRLPVTEEFFTPQYDFGFGPGGGLNTAIKKQTSNNYEIGVRDNTLENAFFNGNIFIKDVENEIYLNPTSYVNSNYDSLVRHYGFELETKGSYWADQIQPFFNGLIQESFFKGGTYSGKKVPFVPQTSVSAGITYAPLKDWRNTLSMNYVGKRFAISDQANAQPKLNSYTTFDFLTSYSFKDVEIWFSAKNLFNREYSPYGVYSSGSGIGFYPVAEKNYLAGVSLDF